MILVRIFVEIFKITIQENISETFNIEANSKKEAIIKVIEDDTENDWIEF